MGLIRAAVGSVKGALADQWKEAVHCPTMSNDIILRRGIRMNPGKGSNTKGNPDVITNGSVILVEENTCMLTVDGGKITNIVTEAGAYEFTNSSAPSIFAGQISEALKDTLQRFMFGGVASTQQRVVYINLMPLPGIPFGTSTPMPYFDPAYNTSIDLRFFGTFEIQVDDAEMAVKFYNQVASKGNSAGDMPVKDIFKSEQYKKEFKQALMKSLNMLSNKGVRYSQISAYLDDLTHEAQEATKNNWFERGFKIVNVAMGAVTLTDESKALLGDRLKADTMLGGDVQRAMMAGSVARGIEAAAGNQGGAMMGFMGMGMANQMGGNVLGGFGQAPDTMQAQQMQQAGMPNAMPPQHGMPQPPQHGMHAPPPVNSNIGAGGIVGELWACTCGSENSSKFCQGCGSPRPVQAISENWVCSCGEENAGKFCHDCGTQKPESISNDWNCSCGATNTGKFCAECGEAKPV
ncbi:MAG: SPFH domain-containing protein [Oscillospiraceae bacterium]|nr:SPFH domain-containing protein [Oscillospiraceae bacterium]